uniref:uncharacterized protein LOC120337561 isoform X1 n=1 Tax=Styela clava TaxID=7725 RepID=UPI00193A12E7|nr:uncharacterized protein LOC120337561 isoform X1 [Styela clava]XP_039261323.1 uncharacterized protein LOC120337561 isoform X1 [Styela clava]
MKMEQFSQNATSSYYNVNETHEPNAAMYWTVFIILTLGVAASALYLFVVFIHKEINFTSRKGDSKAVMLAKIMRVVKIFMTLLIFLESVTSAGFRVFSYKGIPGYCYIGEISKGALANVGSLTIYLIFWLRQRMLYNNSVLRDLTNVFTRTLSAAALSLIVIWHVGIGIVFSMIDPIYEIVNYDCKLVDSDKVMTMVWIALFITIILLQSILLFLFAHPLYNHRKESKWMDNDTKNTNDMLHVLQRAFASALAFVISGALIIFISGFVKHDWVGPILYSTGQFIDLVVVTLSFTDWKQTVMPCCTEPINQFSTRNTTRTFALSMRVMPNSTSSPQK